MTGSQNDWQAANRATWDEMVSLHLDADEYDLSALRAGKGTLHPIEEAELGSVDGLRVLHLQCHFGRDTLTLAQRGAQVVGYDFSGAAVQAATTLAGELGLNDRARFVQGDLYDAPTVLPEPASFDRVFITWGAINWLPDIKGWAKVVAHFLKPGGALYMAEGHPSAFVFDDETRVDGSDLPGYFWPYFSKEPYIEQEPKDYVGDAPALKSGACFEWVHPMGDILTSLIEAGLKLEWLHEHDSAPWRMYECQVVDKDGMWRWPDKPWLPLSFSLWAEREGGA